MEFRGHAQLSEGVTIGSKHSKDAAIYLSSENVEQFAEGLRFRADLEKQHLVPACKTLIVLVSCNTGNFTKQDKPGDAASLVQKLADITDTPVLSPGGFSSGSWVHYAYSKNPKHLPTVKRLADDKTFYEFFGGSWEPRRKAIEENAWDSEDNLWYFTTPNQ